MFKFTRKSVVVAGATAMAIAVGGTAWAYFTASGSVFGTATVDGTPPKVEAISVTAPAIPDVEVAVPVDVTLKANKTVKITSLTLSADTSEEANRAFWNDHAGTGANQCLPGWFDFTPKADVRFEGKTISTAAEGTEIPATESGLQVKLKEMDLPQNGCLGGRIPLTVTFG